MSENNIELARKYLEDVWNAKKRDQIDVLLADDFIDYHYPPEYPRGPEGAKMWFDYVTSALPDINCGIEDIIADGDKVVVRYILSGTHEGELAGIPATNKKVAVPAVSIYYMAEGKIKECWVISGLIGAIKS